MAIRIRKIKGHTVALCAAKAKSEKDDIYLDDNVHHALTVKFAVDFESEGFYVGPVDEKVKSIMLKAEMKNGKFGKNRQQVINDYELQLRNISEAE